MFNDKVIKALSIASADRTAHFGSSAPDHLIAEVEAGLEVTFPSCYRQFIRTVGWCSFGGREFYGITPDGMAARSIPSVAFATLAERRIGRLVQGFIVIEDSGAEETFVLDLRGAEATGEAAVRAWTPGADPTNLEILAPDFGTYLLDAAREIVS
jgi:hypothetical protein